MVAKKIGLALIILFGSNTIFGQFFKEKSELTFLNKQFQTIKHDISLIKKCYVSRDCSAQEKAEAKKSLRRMTIQGATLIALILGIWGTYHFGYKKIATKNSLALLTTHKPTLFKREASGAVGPDPEISTQFIQKILGTNNVYVDDSFILRIVSMTDVISSTIDDIPVGRPIYDKNDIEIGAIGIRPASKEEIGIVLYDNAPSSYHSRLNNLRHTIALTPFDQQVNHWPYIFEKKWGIRGDAPDPGSMQAGPERIISQLMKLAGHDIKSYALINLTGKSSMVPK